MARSLVVSFLWAKKLGSESQEFPISLLLALWGFSLSFPLKRESGYRSALTALLLYLASGAMLPSFRPSPCFSQHTPVLLCGSRSLLCP